MNDPDHISQHLREVIDKLTTEEAFHIWQCKRAVDNAEPPPLMEYEKRERTPEERAFKFAQWGRSIGATDAMIGVELTRVLLARGWDDDEAAELMRDVGIAWTRSQAA